MIVAIHQPHYVPWAGYLAKWHASDVFVVLDTVQYEKNGYQNRTKVDGRWLTVPVHARFATPLRDVTIDHRQPWMRKHRAALPHLADLYTFEWTHLVPLALATMERATARPFVLASDLKITETDPTARLIALVKAVGGTTYLSGPHGARYLDLGRFTDEGLRLEVFEWRPSAGS